MNPAIGIAVFSGKVLVGFTNVSVTRGTDVFVARAVSVGVSVMHGGGTLIPPTTV